MLLLAIWIIVEWYLTAKGSYPANWEFVTNWFVWGFFVLETVVLTCLVRDKRRYLMSNWINLLIIAGGVPLLWGSTAHAGALRSLRILLLFKILLVMVSGGAAFVHQIGQTKAALAIGGALGLLASLAAMFLGYLLTTGT